MGSEREMPNRRRSGDIRHPEMAGLHTMHTLFHREHNRIADALRNHRQVIGRGWSDDDYFQNARRINIAVWQKIVYDEWLPVVMGNSIRYFT